MIRAKFIFALAIGLSLLTACSGDEPEVIDNDFMNGLTRGETSTCYELNSFEVFTKEETSGAKWEKLDLSDYSGWQAPGPRRLVIHDGKTWSPLELFRESTGFHPLYFPYLAFKKRMGGNTEIYVTRPFKYDKEKMVLYLENDNSGNGQEYEVKVLHENKMTLVDSSSFSIYEGKKSIWKWILNYKKIDIDFIELDNNPIYSSIGDAKLGLVRRMKEECGTPFDINRYFRGQLIFPGPFDLDKIEQSIIEGNDWKIGDYMIYDGNDNN